MKDEKENEGLYFVWDGINGDLEQFYTLKQAQDYIKQEFDDEAEGIHPDVEMVFIMKKIQNTEVEVIKQLNSGLGEPEYQRIIFEDCKTF